MRYRTRYKILAGTAYVVVFAFLGGAAVVMVRAVLVERNIGVALVAGAVSGGLMIAVFAGVAYWPTRRRPARLYHVTTSAVVDVATVETHDDGTRTLDLRSERPGGPVYFFDRYPRRYSILYNVKSCPDVCVELLDPDYRDVTVRRRWTGAYDLRGLVRARARIHPLPWDLEQLRAWRRPHGEQGDATA